MRPPNIDPVPMVASYPHLIPRVLLAGVLACLCACTQEQGRDMLDQFADGKPSELFQTSVDRLATLSMRDNLQSLYLLMNKLYLRNPNQLKLSGTSTPPLPSGRSARPSNTASRWRSWATVVTWQP